MAVWKHACKTMRGMELDLKLLGRGGSLMLTKARAGSGHISPTQLLTLTDVLEPVQELGLKAAVECLDEQTVRLPVVLKNTDVEESYDMRQLGVYAEDPDQGEILYLVLQAEGAEAVPSAAEAKDFTLEWYLNLSVGNAEHVEVAIRETCTLTVEEGDVRYVRKVEGKGLSANDYTDEEKKQVAQIGNVSNQANNAYSRANSAYTQANTAYNRANTAYNQANSVYSAVNTVSMKLNSGTVVIGQSSNASSYSIAVGCSANASGSDSTAIGRLANANGFRAIAIGLSANASGNNSIALGNLANASGNNSIALGNSASASGDNSTAIGRNATASEGGSTALGYNAAARGASSVALGIHTLAGYTSTALGCYANACGNNAVALGHNTYAVRESDTAVGRGAAASGGGSTALGCNAYTSTPNGLQLGNASTLSTLSCRVALTVTSDERDKADITEIESGAVEFLKKVKAIRYVFNHRELYIDEENLPEEERKKKEKYGLCEYDREAHAKGTKKGSRIRVGVSAQETQKALEEIYGSSGYANLINDNLFDLDPDEIPEGVESQLTANYDGFIPFLIKAVQELAERLEAVEESTKGAATV